MDSASKKIISHIREKLVEQNNQLRSNRGRQLQGSISKGGIKILKVLKIGAALFIFVMIGLVFYIKLNTSSAANLTDNILRPLLGDSRVVYLEKIFFNASDLAQRLTHNSSSCSSHACRSRG